MKYPKRFMEDASEHVQYSIASLTTSVQILFHLSVTDSENKIQ